MSKAHVKAFKRVRRKDEVTTLRTLLSVNMEHNSVSYAAAAATSVSPHASAFLSL
jgi:hypothetical protein